MPEDGGDDAKEQGRPILLTGAHRTGSTWIGRMLSLPERVSYIHEPFNKVHPRGVSEFRPDVWFPYLPALDSDIVDGVFERIFSFDFDFWGFVRDLSHPRDIYRFARDFPQFHRADPSARAVVKDPNLSFSARWLSRKYGFRVVILVRHPAAFAGSLKVKGWGHPFEDFLSQPELMDDLLEGYTLEIERMAAGEQPIADQAALLWTMIYDTLYDWIQEEDWLLVRHEDVALNPLDGFERLYNILDLPYTDQVRDAIIDHSGEENPVRERTPFSRIKRDSEEVVESWRERLTLDEIERIRDHTTPVVDEYYDEPGWPS